jgi:ribosome biogenesis protein ERB1
VNAATAQVIDEAEKTYLQDVAASDKKEQHQ